MKYMDRSIETYIEAAKQYIAIDIENKKLKKANLRKITFETTKQSRLNILIIILFIHIGILNIEFFVSFCKFITVFIFNSGFKI